MGRQNFTCSTPDCMYWNNDEDGCTKGSITMEDHCCLDYEERPAEKVSIIVSGGVVQSVYSTLPRENLVVELLDYDNARQEGNQAELEMQAREVFVGENYNQIF